MKQKSLSERKFQGLLLFGCILFYGFFTWLDGAVICVDSPSYINMNIDREPIYPLFLSFFRFLFGEGEMYLTAAVFVQGMLCAVAAWELARFLTKEFGRLRPDNLVLLSLPLFVSLLCRFGAKRAAMYSNSILSEGICIPLFLLFARWMLEYCFRKGGKALLMAAVLSVISVSTRKQMLITVILLAAGVVFTEVNRKNLFRVLGKAVLCAVAVLLLVSGIDRVYNLVLRGEGVRHSSDDRFLLTVVFYEAERENAEKIDDEQIRELFLEIYDSCEAEGYLGHSAGKGWFNRVEHFTDNYDHIQIDTMWPMIRKYVSENRNGSEVEQEAETDRIMSVITEKLLPVEAGGIFRIFADNVLAGLVTTVAKLRKLLVIYAIIAYSSMVVLWGINWKKRGFRSRENILAVYTAVSVLLNVGAVAAVIFCQTRYVIYNMPLFYMCGYLLLRSALEEIRTKGETAVVSGDRKDLS